jgi:hypothetical protein
VKLLIAPVPITPTKPLTRGDTDFSGLSESDIGELYQSYHQQEFKPRPDALRPYSQVAESGTWLHPVSVRLHEIWSRHTALLAVPDPATDRKKRTALPLDELIRILRNSHMCIDLRNKGGGLFLDRTSDGLPLRRAIAPDGRTNYLINLLRDLVPRVPEYDQIILIHDVELHADYLLLQRILMGLGASVERVPLSRVAINGSVQSTRYGGWQGFTSSEIIGHCLQLADVETIRLATRLYFIAILGKVKSKSFDMAHLEKSILRARQLMAAAEARCSTEAIPIFLERCAGKQSYVDPYRVTTELLSKRRLTPLPRTGGPGWYM